MSTVASSATSSPFLSLKSSSNHLRHQLRPRSTGSSNPGSRTASSPMPGPDLEDSNQSLFLSFSPHSCASPAPSDASSKLLPPAFDSAIGSDQFFIDTSSVPIAEVGLYMPQSLEFSHGRPASMGLPPAEDAYSSETIRSWGQPAGAVGTAAVANSTNAHRRQQSNSSVGSTVASSVSAYQTSRLGDFDCKPASYNINHLPTPTGTPTRTSAMHSNKSLPPLTQSMASTSLSPMAITGGLLGSHLVRPTASLAEPSTPLTVVSDYTGDAQTRQTGENEFPDIDTWLEQYLRDPAETDRLKFDRMPDVYRDDVYFSQALGGSQQHYMVPQSPVVRNQLHASHMMRSPSGSSSQSAPMSAFKANAPYMQTQLGVSDQRDAQDLQYAVSPRSDSGQKTISPQEALLDHEPSANDMALFGARNYNMYPLATSATSQTFQTPTSMSFTDNSGIGQWSSALTQNAMSTAPLYGSFAAPAMPASMAGPALASHQFLAPPARGMRHGEHTPEFPAHLTSMDSSASETAPPSSAASARVLSPPKPNTGADTGTYSCTYSGCAQRFSTPQKLQKHKRDVHRTTPNVTPGIGSGMSPTELMERNSQAGPHKCERINPGTGKPCNAIFSRPYDLTRHEDTIHNIRKQKSRCALCTEEKTFSRSDALTRHMRVVHPEVDFPGKYRRRGGARD